MNVNSNHPMLRAIFEKLRKEKGLTIGELCHEAHIARRTYEKVKKGMMRD